MEKGISFYYFRKAPFSRGSALFREILFLQINQKEKVAYEMVLWVSLENLIVYIKAWLKTTALKQL